MKKEKVKKLKTMEEVKAFSDPYRMKILSTFILRNVPLTVKQVADILEETPAKVHYHVKKLINTDLLTLDHTEKVNGIIAKFYIPTAEDFEIEIEDKQQLNMGEAEQTMYNIFQHVEKVFLDQFKKAEAYKKTHDINDLGEEKVKGSIHLGEVYVTHEEMKEIERSIENIHKKYMHKKRNTQEDRRCYHLLYGYMREFDKE